MEKVQRRKYRRRRLLIRRTIVCFCAGMIMFALANGTIAIVKGISEKIERQAPAAPALFSSVAASSSPETVPAAAVSSAHVKDSQRNTPDPASAAKVPFNDAVFIGDSRTEGLENYDGLEGATYFAVKGLMVNTAYTKKAIDIAGKKETVMQALKSKKFSRVYIMLGVNELGWNNSSKFVEDYEMIIDDIYRDVPKAKVYVQSILPVSAKKSESDPIYNNQKIKSYNNLLKQMAQKKGVVYLDAAQAVRNCVGALPEEASSDGVHLNAAYCKKWCNFLISQKS